MSMIGIPTRDKSLALNQRSVVLESVKGGQYAFRFRNQFRGDGASRVPVYVADGGYDAASAYGAMRFERVSQAYAWLSRTTVGTRD